MRCICLTFYRSEPFAVETFVLYFYNFHVHSPPPVRITYNLMCAHTSTVVSTYFSTEIYLNRLQGWRVPYYVSGMIGLIVAALAITTMTEPKRTAISEEAEADSNDVVSKPRPGQAAIPAESTEKTSIWKVLFQPKILILCIAASIRHTGTYRHTYTRRHTRPVDRRRNSSVSLEV